jgi:hypothetical protein
MTKDEQISKLRAALMHDKTCYFGSHRCSHPEARARREIERLLGEPITPHGGLDAQERENRYHFHDTGE